MKNVFEYKVKQCTPHEMDMFIKCGGYINIYKSDKNVYYFLNPHAEVIKVQKESPTVCVWRYITQNSARTIRIEDKIYKLDRLVGEYFLPPHAQDGKCYEIVHKDGDKVNSDVENLCWRSRGERISAYKQEHKFDIILKKLQKLGNIDDDDDDITIMKLED